MKFKINGKYKHMCKAELKFASVFFAQYLMGTKLPKNLEIELDFAEMPGRIDGYCNPIDAERKPRMFEIGLHPRLRRHKMLQTMAHEMVHVKQYARGELSNELITAKWQGKTYKITNTLEAYLEYPWEIEAFGRDRGMYLLYQLMLRQEKIKFKNGKMYMRGKYISLKKEKENV